MGYVIMGKTVVITGANRGIGLALCEHYAAKKFTVVGVCRRSSEELKVLDVHVIEAIDVTKDESAHELKVQLQNKSVDILINNAGILGYESLPQIDFSSILRQFEVNALGSLRVTHALLGQLSVGAKVALITSRMGSIADNTSGAYYGYRMSKAALNAAGMSLALDLKDRKIAVGIFHPGYVQTDMTAQSGDIAANAAAVRLAQRIESLTMDNSGVFQHANGELLPW